ncbi:MAG: response regulator [Aggregatilineales bacterium]
MTTADEGFILVVDDNEMNRDMLSRRLQRQGYEVAVAEHGERALEMMRSDNFDLVLLDIMMPRLNGYQVLEQVKADNQLKHIPIIMISAVDDLDSVVKCIELGAEDYLFKPFNPVLLKARVRAGLDKKRANELSSSTVGSSAENADQLTEIQQSLTKLVSGELGQLNSAQSDLLEHVITLVKSFSN